ncbi:MAG TPA: glycosyltransferase [Rhizobiales bacterium]|nr:glycosyltransferase [Hyphomicrobiales bacterium]
MAKEPRAGAVKTRLAQGIGVSAATGFYRNTLARQLLSSGHDPRWQSWLAIAPDTALEARCWPMSITPIAQGRGDLGARMQRVFDRLPPGPAVIIGSDIPAIRPRHIAAAFRLLGSADAVFGPAEDGGYWLVGLRRCPRILKIFRDVRWSGPQALADTCSNLENQKTRFLETLYDIDTAEDYRRWKRRSAP